MQLNPKKIIGSLGRKYGGEPFQKIRKSYYDSIAFFNQLYELTFLVRGTYAPNHPDKKFYEKYYTKNISGKRDHLKEGFICLCDGRMYHGGPTDRLRGILTTYREVKKTGVPFYISWTNPFNLEDYLVPAGQDWRINPDDIVYDKESAFPFIIEDEPDFHSFLRMKAGLKHHKPQLHVYSNADNARGNYRELYHELFKPSPLLQKETERHLRILGNRFSAYTFRFLSLLGDFKEWSETTLSDNDAILFMKRVADEFLRLTKEVPENERILVTSDSKRFLEYIQKLDPRVYVVPGEVKNIDLLEGEYREAWLKTFVDQQLLMNASKVTLMRTGKMYKSGFPRFAAEVGGAEYIDHCF